MYNVTPAAVGVIVYKVVGNRYIEKRVNLRVEHVRHSKCRQEFLDRVKSNHDAHAIAKEKGGELLTSHVFWIPILMAIQNASTCDASLPFLGKPAPSLLPKTPLRPLCLSLTRQLSRWNAISFISLWFLLSHLRMHGCIYSITALCPCTRKNIHEPKSATT